MIKPKEVKKYNFLRLALQLQRLQLQALLVRS